MALESPSLFRRVKQLRKESRSDEALALLRDALRREQLEAEEVEKAGRLIQKELAGFEPTQIDAHVLLLGQCTTPWLANSLAAVAWGQGEALPVADGEYDNVMQELMAAAQTSAKPDVVVLMPWNQRLLFGGGDRSAQDRIDDELAFWHQAWSVAVDRLGARVLQVGYDWVTPGAMGHHLGGAADGTVDLIRRTNAALRAELPQGAFFVDLEQASGTIGRQAFYDPRRHYWTKQPLSESGARCLAEHLWAGIRATLTGPKKVLALDLDNTLWGGVVGETGPLGIALGESPEGEAFRDFQRHVKELSARGVLLTVCSKNNPQDAREPFTENAAMILSLEEIADFQASWDPKAMALERTAEALNLGLDSLVFFDDNPAEREQVRQALPEVTVVEVPEDPAEYIRALQAGLWFESVAVTGADRQRSEQYQQQGQRKRLKESAGSIEDYLQSLAMRADVRPIDQSDMQRVVQLIGKTNQFNLTTRRHGTGDVRQMLAQPGAIGLSLRVADRFGDYGLVAVVLGAPDENAPAKTLRIDTLLMSCRVIGRTVEEFFFNALLHRAREAGYQCLLGEFLPTRKNGLVADLYE
ncbi:MAG: HAD-IIIC family phosphatase, partial [Planctomycetes bacterium]|nr:HAD-IIIC family phosphatase [Planctomycetota bacterium]